MEYGCVLKPNQLSYIDEPVNSNQGTLYFPVQSGKDAVILYIRPNSDGYVTVYGGDGIFGGKTLDVDVYENRNHFIHLETGRFMITQGKNKGHIAVEGDCDAEICLVEIG